MSYNDVIKYFFEAIPNYHKYGSKDFKPGLEKISDLLNVIGNPEKDLRFIHIAGTNGKGSTCNFLNHFLVESGYSTGLFTSPHLFDFRERIRVNNNIVPKDFILAFYNKHKSVFDQQQPSFFELTFALALAYFKDQDVDICVLETGLGGRLDATNIVIPEICGITNIGLDHTEFLGDSLEEIAKEKGGIIKENIPVVIGDMENKCKNILVQIANEHKAKVIHPKTFTTEYFNYQQDNLNLARTLLEELRSMGWKSINTNKAISQLNIIGRFQTIQERPKIIIDVAHNKEGFETLFAQKEILESEQLHILFGGTKEKDLNTILNLFPLNANINFSSFSNSRSLTEKDFELQNTVKVFTYYNDPLKAFQEIKAKLKSNDTFLICGSFYLVADLKPLLDLQS